MWRKRARTPDRPDEPTPDRPDEPTPDRPDEHLLLKYPSQADLTVVNILYTLDCIMYNVKSY